MCLQGSAASRRCWAARPTCRCCRGQRGALRKAGKIKVFRHYACTFFDMQDVPTLKEEGSRR